MEQLKTFLSLLKIDPEKIDTLSGSLGGWLYVLLFAIIFAETGLVVVPFLPGDSLLFALGAVAAHQGSPINIGLTAVLLIAAAVLGDALNYAVGHFVGPAVFKRENSRLLNQRHLQHAHDFYERHGAKTIVYARFIPIVRTFAPFVAGIGAMTYAKFALYNVVGGVVWVLVCLGAGWYFGKFAVVQKNFEIVLVAVVVISLLPPVLEYLRSRMRKPRVEAAAAALVPGIDTPEA